MSPSIIDQGNRLMPPKRYDRGAGPISLVLDSRPLNVSQRRYRDTVWHKKAKPVRFSVERIVQKFLKAAQRRNQKRVKF